MTGTYDYRMVLLSVVLALAASYAALDLAGRVTAAQGRARNLWLVGGAMAMGIGIWAMHYIGMLAFAMPMPILYDLPTVALSLVAAIGASVVALFIVSRPTMAVAPQIIGSIVMGSGIAAMHYIGMAAMRLPCLVSYSPAIVVFSVALAIVISLVALLLAFGSRNEKRTSRRKIVSALVMGTAISVMHYTGMAAASFSPSEKILNLSHAVNISSLGTVAITVASLLVLTLAIVTSFLDRLIGAQKQMIATARESALQFHTLAEAIPQMIWTATPEGQPDYFNSRWYNYTGISAATLGGDGWSSVVHPDYRSQAAAKWQTSLQAAELYENEIPMLRASDHTYRWHLVRAIPIKNPAGSVLKWFGTCTDIDHQKNNQANLEAEIIARTAEVVAANARLQEEMQDREQAQLELNRQSASLVRELTRGADRALLLNRMGKLLQSSANMQEALSIILGFAPKFFPEFHGALLLLNGSRSMIEVSGAWGDCDLKASAFEANCCWALRAGHPHLAAADDRTARCTHGDLENIPYLCVPILAQGGAVGVLHFQATASDKSSHLSNDEFSDSEIAFTETFAEQVGLSIVNLKLQDALRSQSTRDALTSLFNRRHFEESLDREIRRAARGGQSVGIIMFDLDHFKKFNDTFGHEAGDCVLREIGAFLMKGARAEDIACRYGGEEFVLILPGADLKGAQTRAQRLRSKVRELVILHQGKSLGMVTISVGVAAFPDHGETIKDLMGSADAALYRSKREGRDRVSVAELPVEGDLVSLPDHVTT